MMSAPLPSSRTRRTARSGPCARGRRRRRPRRGPSPSPVVPPIGRARAGAAGRDADDRGAEHDAGDGQSDDAIRAEPRQQSDALPSSGVLDRACAVARRGQMGRVESGGRDAWRRTGALACRRAAAAAERIELRTCRAATRLRVWSTVAGSASRSRGRRRRPMTRWTPTDAFSNTVSWRVDGPVALGRCARDGATTVRVAVSSWGSLFAADARDYGLTTSCATVPRTLQP